MRQLRLARARRQEADCAAVEAAVRALVEDSAPHGGDRAAPAFGALPAASVHGAVTDLPPLALHLVDAAAGPSLLQPVVCQNPQTRIG
jgi:hypothetical protein